MNIQKLNRATFSEKDVSTTTFSISNANLIFSIGDVVNVACDSNTQTFSSDYNIINVSSTTVTLNTSVNLPSSINADSKRLYIF